jgi:hypothetical protein
MTEQEAREWAIRCGAECGVSDGWMFIYSLESHTLSLGRVVATTQYALPGEWRAVEEGGR